MIEGFIDGIRSVIAMVRERQLVVAWVKYAHERFTLLRDLNTLKNLGLMSQIGQCYKARSRVVEAFLPPVAATTRTI